jgi:signal transduction histidine kinase
VSERPLRFRRLQAIDPKWVDVALAGFAVVVIAISMVTQANSQYKEMTPVAGTILSATGLALLLRRSHPLTGLVLAGSAVAIFTGLDYDVAGASAALLLSVYAVGAYGKRLQSLLGLAYVLGIILVLWLIGTPEFDSGQALQNWAVFTAAWMFGESMATRRKYLASLEERAALLEADRERKAQQAVIDERRRIAQELHDVVAHAMSVIAVQAGVGAHVIDSNPDEARKSLAAIESTSREALQEMRRMLGVLRDDGDAKGLLTSAPTQVDLARLIANVEAAGVPVTLRYEGDFPADIPESVRLNGFRILQEALTNVVKHAGKASAIVTIGRRPGIAWFEVVDDGRGITGEPSRDGTGAGLSGMRERVALFGGRLEAGPRQGGGFRVAAWLPFQLAVERERPASMPTP